jgi:hypothetical protein
MGAGYAKEQGVVASYAKSAPSAGGRKDIQHIAHPPYRDAAVVLTAGRWRGWGAEGGDDEAD